MFVENWATINLIPKQAVLQLMSINLIKKVSSNLGLCGSYNTSIAKSLRNKINLDKNDKKEFRILFLGTKVLNAFSDAKNEGKVLGVIRGLSDLDMFTFDNSLHISF